MTDRYEVEVLLRPPVELTSAIVAGSSAGIAIAAPHLLMMTPQLAYVTAGILATVAIWRGRQAWRVLSYQRHIKRAPRYVLRSSKIPTSRSVLFLGRGFRWTQKHTERLYAARDKRAEGYLQPNPIKQWFRHKEIQWEHTTVLKKIMRWSATDSAFNPVRPPPATGGDAIIHGVGIEAETNVTLPLSERVGHMVVIARTRHGKTRLAEILTTQDIRRADNCVIVLDPKGDADYLKRVFIETQKEGRPFVVFHLGYPELSARYNAIGSFSRITEVASRIASQLPGEGEASAFKEFAWQFVNVIAVALNALGEVPDFMKIRRYITDIDPLLVRYTLHFLQQHGPEHWQEEVEEEREKLNVKSLPRMDQGKDPEAITLVRYLKANELMDPVLEGLISAFRYDREYFQKITVAVKPFLEKLTTGNIASIIAPTLEGDDRPVLDWLQAIRQRSVVYVGLDALTDPEVASAVGESMFSDLTSLAGHIYKHGVDSHQSKSSNNKSPSIVIHGDEFSDLLGPKFKTLVNKSGGAGYELNLYTQTWSDVVAELGSDAKAGQLAGNIGTVVIMGVKEIATCEMFTKQLPDVSISEIMAVSGVTDNSESEGGINFVSNNQDRVSISRVPMISPADIVALPKGQAFVLLKGSELWKVRIPLPSKLDDKELPNDLGDMLQHMRRDYVSIVDWHHYQRR